MLLSCCWQNCPSSGADQEEQARPAADVRTDRTAAGEDSAGHVEISSITHFGRAPVDFYPLLYTQLH